MPPYFWLIPLASAIFLFISLGYLTAKSSGLSRELLKFGRRKQRFITGLKTVDPTVRVSALPSLPNARSKRRAVVTARAAKRQARQRRLVEHLKDLQNKESE